MMCRGNCMTNTAKIDFTPILVNKLNPQRLKAESDKLARIAAMITNIDENVGRLFSKLDDPRRFARIQSSSI